MKSLKASTRVRIVAALLILSVAAIGYSAVVLRRASASPGAPAAQPLVIGTCESLPGGVIEVEGTGGTAAQPTGYATLQAAFAAINTGGHTGPITIDVCGNTTETAPAVLNASGGTSAYSTILIAPAGGAARTISGAIAAGSPLVDLNGADNVTINGLNTGGNSLTISNTTIGTTAGSSTIRFIADASTNTVTNTTILGSSASTLATVAGTVLFSTGTTTGNDGNTVSNNNIGPAGANLPSKAIMASGTSATIENDNASITGNNIFDYFLATGSHSAINILTGNEAWTISTNRFYQTATRTVTTAASRHSAITLNNSTGGFTVSGNIIGFSAANGTGTYTITGTSNEFRAIDAASVRTTAPATEIQNNTITAINQTSSRASTTTASSAFIAVAMGTTDGLINATGNTIGSLDGSTTIVINETSTTASTAPVIGFYNFSFVSTNISSNNIGAITIQSGGTGTVTGFRGILVNTSSSQAATINSNTIGGTTAAGAITDTQVGAYAMYGIQTSLPTLSATGNTVRNMSGASNGAALIVSSGILASGSTGANTISQNTIHSLSNASGAAANSIYGMSLGLPAAANVIERNFLHSFSLTSTATGTQIWGISGGATGTATYKNNMIRLGIDAAGNSITLPASIIGMRDAAGSTNQVYHNSIYIGGSGVLATPVPSNSYAFFSDVVTVTRAHLDNIFWNARSNAVAGGVAHLATREGGTAANPPGLTSNYNVLYASGTDGATGVFNGVIIPTLAAWRTATGQDTNSIAADPQFINPTGTAATVDLHIHPTNPTPIEGAGLAVPAVTDDFDGQARAALTPTDIGADAGNFVALDISPPIIVYTPLANTSSTANRTISVTITDATGVAGGANLPRIYFKKSTDAGYVSTQCVMTGGTPQNGTYNCTIDYSLVGGGGVAIGDVIQYFVVAQDTAGNLGSNPGGATGANVNTVTFSGTPNSYTIVPAISGGKTVGAGGDYPTLTAAVAALNGAEITGPVTLTLTDATYPTETFPITINANGGSSSTNTVIIKPAAGISPTISGSSTSCIININGADWVTVDGSNGGGTPPGTSRDLTLVNTNAGTATAVMCITSTGAGAGATNNTVKNNNLVGSTITATAGTLAGVFSGSSTISITSAGADNDNNTIQNNNVTKTQYGIYTGGASAANKNTGTVITQNVMNAPSPNNITTGGILANFEDGIQISQNDISVLKHDGTTGTTTTAFGIALGVVPNNTTTGFTGSDVTGAVVTRNRINGVTQLNSTGYSSFGIVVNSVTSGTTLLANNMISGVRSASTPSDFSAGILAGGGTGSTTQIYHNSVAMTGARGAATNPSYGLAINTGNPIVDVKNNIFYNTQTSSSTGKMYAIANASTTFTNMSSNFNDFFVTGASSFVGQTGGLGTAGTDQLTLGNWQTATGQDNNSQVLDPAFVNPASDLHLQPSSPLLGDGTPLAGVPVDFDNDPRPATAPPNGPDIGADELVQSAGGVIPAGNYFNVSTAPGDTLGGNVTVRGNLALNGVTTTGANTLIIGCGGSVSGASDTNYVDGNVQKDFCAPGTFTYPVGDPATGSLAPPTNGYMPVDVTVTALATNPSSLAVSANNGLAPSTPPLDPTRTLSAFWTLTETGDMTANLSFHYQQGDVNGIEANYRVIAVEGGTPFNFPTTVLDTTENIATVPGITNFSDWTVGEAFAPTSSPANVSGRVLSINGFPLSGVTMTLLDTILVQNRTTVTDANGEYHFEAVLTGRDIVVTPSRLGFNFSPQTRTFPHTGNVSNIDFTASFDSTVPRPTSNDFDGDGKTDLSVFRPADATWYIFQSSTNSVNSVQWGLLGDKIVPADYDGDRKTDVAVFRPSNTTWYIQESTTGGMRAVQWGLADDVMTPADFDGDGKVDVAVWRPSNGTWYIRESLTGNIRSTSWGTAGDRPVAADYDADGKADLAVFRPSTGVWYVIKSSDGSNLFENWGLGTDRPVVGDYDGDTKSDLAVFRPETGTWYVKFSTNGTVNSRAHGTSTDVLTPGDYDGDGKIDHAVWQNATGNWNILRSATGTASGQQWGINGDIPAPSAYIP